MIYYLKKKKKKKKKKKENELEEDEEDDESSEKDDSQPEQDILLVKKACLHLLNHIIPNFITGINILIQQHIQQDNFVMNNLLVCSKLFIKAMHQYGINCRYLSNIADLCVPSINSMLLEEMICRCLTKQFSRHRRTLLRILNNQIKDIQHISWLEKYIGIKIDINQSIDYNEQKFISNFFINLLALPISIIQQQVNLGSQEQQEEEQQQQEENPFLGGEMGFEKNSQEGFGSATLIKKSTHIWEIIIPNLLHQKYHISAVYSCDMNIPLLLQLISIPSLFLKLQMSLGLYWTNINLYQLYNQHHNNEFNDEFSFQSIGQPNNQVDHLYHLFQQCNIIEYTSYKIPKYQIISRLYIDVAYESLLNKDYQIAYEKYTFIADHFSSITPLYIIHQCIMSLFGLYYQSLNIDYLHQIFMLSIHKLMKLNDQMMIQSKEDYSYQTSLQCNLLWCCILLSIASSSTATATTTATTASASATTSATTSDKPNNTLNQQQQQQHQIIFNSYLSMLNKLNIDTSLTFTIDHNPNIYDDMISQLFRICYVSAHTISSSFSDLIIIQSLHSMMICRQITIYFIYKSQLHQIYKPLLYSQILLRIVRQTLDFMQEFQYSNIYALFIVFKALIYYEYHQISYCYDLLHKAINILHQKRKNFEKEEEDENDENDAGDKEETCQKKKKKNIIAQDICQLLQNLAQLFIDHEDWYHISLFLALKALYIHLNHYDFITSLSSFRQCIYISHNQPVFDIKSIDAIDVIFKILLQNKPNIKQLLIRQWNKFYINKILNKQVNEKLLKYAYQVKKLLVLEKPRET